MYGVRATVGPGVPPLKFRGYDELTEDEREAAREYAARMGVSPTELMRRMAGWGRLDHDTEYKS